MHNNFSTSLIVLLLLFLILTTNACGQNKQVEPQANRKQSTQKNKKYLYYLHGRIVEDLGADNAVSERFGKYEYKEILKTFKEKGFEVISEARPRNTDVEDYSNELTKDIKAQIKNGISPDNITVVGASKGSLIAMLTSTKLANKNVKFVILANCIMFWK